MGDFIGSMCAFTTRFIACIFHLKSKLLPSVKILQKILEATEA